MSTQHMFSWRKALLMSTHNICFCGEIRKIICGYPLLSVALFYINFLLRELVYTIFTFDCLFCMAADWMQ